MTAKQKKAKIEAFEAALEALCVEHGVIVYHEDGAGSGLIELASPSPGCNIPFHLPWQEGGAEVWALGGS